MDYKALDLVSDRNNLRKLLQWAEKRSEHAFRIDVELVGTKTVVFSRCEEETIEIVPPGKFRGFGQEFERVVTSGKDQYTTCHHRIITYVRQRHPRKPQIKFNCLFLIQNLATLKVLLRFEVDACIPSVRVADLTDALSGMGLSSTASVSKTSELTATTPSSSSPTTTSPIPVQLTGTPLVAQDSLVEVTTMSKNRNVNWNRYFPQLYLSGTPHFYVGKHFKGSFTDIARFHLHGSNLRPYAQAVEQGLGKLVKSLEELSEYLQEAGPGIGFSLIGDVSGDLKLYRREKGTGRGLTEDIVARFT